MSYCEYIDMFFETQKKDCSYRAFTFDIVNSRNQKQYIEESEKYYSFIGFVYNLLELEEQRTGKQILLKDKFNQKLKYGEPISNINYYNPLILGDMATYFVYNGSISNKRIVQLFIEGLKKFNIEYSFHFKTGIYETNKYEEGGIKLYKGYMPQILEDLSKKSTFIINKDFNNLEAQNTEKTELL